MSILFTMLGCTNNEPVKLGSNGNHHNTNDTGLSTPTYQTSNGQIDILGTTARTEADVTFTFSEPFLNDYGFTITLNQAQFNFTQARMFSPTGQQASIPLDGFDISSNQQDETLKRLGNEEVPMMNEYSDFEIELHKGSDACSVRLSGDWEFDDNSTSDSFDICVNDNLTLSGPFQYEAGGYLFSHTLSPSHHGGIGRMGIMIYYDGASLDLTDNESLEKITIPGLFNGIHFEDDKHPESVIKKNILSGSVLPLSIETQ